MKEKHTRHALVTNVPRDYRQSWGNICKARCPESEFTSMIDSLFGMLLAAIGAPSSNVSHAAPGNVDERIPRRYFSYRQEMRNLSTLHCKTNTTAAVEAMVAARSAAALMSFHNSILA